MYISLLPTTKCLPSNSTIPSVVCPPYCEVTGENATGVTVLLVNLKLCIDVLV